MPPPAPPPPAKHSGGASSPAFDCGFGMPPMAWPHEKKEWCCRNMNRGCEHTTIPPQFGHDSMPPGLTGHDSTPPGFQGRYDCNRDAVSVWAQNKAEWCCRHEHKGCGHNSPPPGLTGHGSMPPGPPGVLPGLPGRFDCNKDAVFMWAKDKAEWCCRSTGLGCPGTTTGEPEFDCTQGFADDMWVIGWSAEKSQFCCKKGFKTCSVPTTTSENGERIWDATTLTSTTTMALTTLTSTTSPDGGDAFDCNAGTENAQKGWSVWKKRWCCSNKKIGCLTNGEDNAIMGTFHLKCLRYNALKKDPTLEKVAWETIKESLAQLACVQPAWADVARKRKLSVVEPAPVFMPSDFDADPPKKGPCSAKNVWLEQWKDATGCLVIHFVITLPAVVSFSDANGRVTCDSIGSAVIPAVQALDRIEKVSATEMEIHECHVDMHQGKIPCTCEDGQPLDKDHCPAHGGNLCTSCIIGYHLNTQRQCEANECHCEHGIAAIGPTCATSGEHSCGFCKLGYHLERLGSEGGGRGIFECRENICTCQYGVEAKGVACDAHHAAICDRCESGYHVVSPDKVCMVNTCYCSAGEPSETIAHEDDEPLSLGDGRGDNHEVCSADGAHSCRRCSKGFHLNTVTEQCDPNVCTCDSGTAAVGPVCVEHNREVCVSCEDNAYLTQNGQCGNKKCVCTNGVPVDETACTTNRGQICQTCNPGYVMWGKTQQCVSVSCDCENGTPRVDCDTAKGISGCSSCSSGFHLAGHRCVKNTCECSHGVAAKGSTCLENGLQVCDTCFHGYHHTMDNADSGRITVHCKRNECTCSNGEVATAQTSPMCESHKGEMCSACKPGFQLFPDHICRMKHCTCENGHGTRFHECEVHGTANCAQCDENYHLTKFGVALKGTMQCRADTLTTEAFDCEAGFDRRMVGWSLLKKSWCCENKQVGCLDYLETGKDLCSSWLDQTRCESLGCCRYRAGRGCSSAVGDTGACHPRRVVTVAASESAEDEGGLYCLAAVGVHVRVKSCNPWDDSQLWRWDCTANQLRSDSGFCLTADGDLHKGKLKMEACDAQLPQHQHVTWAAAKPKQFEMISGSATDKPYCLSVRDLHEEGGYAVMKVCDDKPETIAKQSWDIPQGARDCSVAA